MAAAPANEYAAAIEAARLRLSAAKMWATTSAEMLERAQKQVALSQEELRDARLYLEQLLGLCVKTNGGSVEVAGDGVSSVPNPSESVGQDVIGENDAASASKHMNESAQTESTAAITLIPPRANAISKHSADGGDGSEPSSDSSEANQQGSANVRVDDASCNGVPDACNPGESSDEVAIVRRVSLSASSSSGGIDVDLEDEKGEDRDTVQGNTNASPLRIKKGADESYDEFLSIISESPEKDLAEAEIDGLIKKCDQIMDGSDIEVLGSGISEVNGRYCRFGVRDGVPAYAKIAKYDGKEAMFQLCRWQSFANGTKKWYITAIIPGGGADTYRAFYCAYAPSFYNRPPRRGYMAVLEGDELFLSPKYKGRGADPPPVLNLETDEDDGKSFGRKLSSALGTSSRRRRGDGDTVRSIPSVSSLSTKSKSRASTLMPNSVYLPAEHVHV